MKMMVLQKRPSQGRARSVAHAAGMHDEHNTSYMQLSTKIAKLEKSNKKFKPMNKKCKHSHDSDSDDSDSSWMGPVALGN